MCDRQIQWKFSRLQLEASSSLPARAGTQIKAKKNNYSVLGHKLFCAPNT